MPFDVSGNWTQPTNTAAVAGEIADPNAFNTLVTDIAAALSRAVLRDISTPFTVPVQAVRMILNGSVALEAALRLPVASSDPSSPQQGDVFISGGRLKARVDGLTRTLATSDDVQPISGLDPALNTINQLTLSRVAI